MLNLFSLLLIISVAIARPPAPANSGQPMIPADRGPLTDLEGIVGRMDRCESPTASELTQVDACIESSSIQGSPADVAKFGTRWTENYAEHMFFQEMTIRSHQATTCQLQLLNNYGTNPAAASEMNNAAWQIAEPLYPVLNSMLNRVSEKSALRASIRQGHEVGDHSIADANRMLRVAHLDEEIAYLNQGINSLISNIPMGNQPDVKDAIRSAAAQNPMARETFVAAYARGLGLLRPKVQRAEDFYRSNYDSATQFYNIGRGDKIAIMQSGQGNALLSQIDPQGNKLRCRLRAQYETGPVATQTAAFLALIAASVATDGLAAALIIGAGTTATIVSQIHSQCYGNTTNTAARPTLVCTPQAVASSALSEASRASCGSALVMGGAAVLAPFAVALMRANGTIATLNRNAGVIDRQLEEMNRLSIQIRATNEAERAATEAAAFAQLRAVLATPEETAVVSATRPRLPSSTTIDSATAARLDAEAAALADANFARSELRAIIREDINGAAKDLVNLGQSQPSRDVFEAMRNFSSQTSFVSREYVIPRSTVVPQMESRGFGEIVRTVQFSGRGDNLNVSLQMTPPSNLSPADLLKFNQKVDRFSTFIRMGRELPVVRSGNTLRFNSRTMSQSEVRNILDRFEDFEFGYVDFR